MNKTHKRAAPGPPTARRVARLQGNVGAGTRQRRAQRLSRGAGRPHPDGDI